MCNASDDTAVKKHQIVSNKGGEFVTKSDSNNVLLDEHESLRVGNIVLVAIQGLK
jgi:hypothetical protein